MREAALRDEALLSCTHAITRQGSKLGFISRRDFCSGVCSALVGLLEPARADFVQSSEAVSLSAWSALVGVVESCAFCASLR